MNSKVPQAPAAILDEVLKLLSEANLSRKIDEPIDREVAVFQIKPDKGIEYKNFIGTIGQFIRCIYQSALGQRLTTSQSQAEAISLLEIGYPNSCEDGYHMAYIDAKDDIIPVLQQIAIIVKTRMRSRYIKWVLNRYIDPLNWSLKYKILDTLRERSFLLPSNVARLPSCQLIGEIDKLLLDVTSSIDTVFKCLRTDEILINF